MVDESQMQNLYHEEQNDLDNVEIDLDSIPRGSEHWFTILTNYERQALHVDSLDPPLNVDVEDNEPLDVEDED